jgi:hypothetical protein
MHDIGNQIWHVVTRFGLTKQWLLNFVDASQQSRVLFAYIFSALFYNFNVAL